MQSQFDPKHRIQYSSRLLVLVGIFILCNFMIFPLIGFSAIAYVYEIGVMEIPNVLASPSAYSYGVNVMLWLQIITSFGGFFVSSFVFLKSYSYPPFEYLKLNKMPVVKAILLCLFIIVANIGIVSLLGGLNYRIPIPEFGGLQEIAARMNERASAMMESMLVMNGLSDLLIRLFVMALLPAFVEEVFFRGLLQRFITEWFGSIWTGIIVSALVFALFHFRITQILPIFFVGLLFGYIYYRTGNLYYTILMHFVHNGSIVILTYLVRDKDAQAFMQEDYIPGWEWIVPSIFGLVIGVYFLLKLFPLQPNSKNVLNQNGGDNE
ncbi:MAG: CPBP family intramembrane metalloprotease [Bacteroidia bacterium]|nr:CPBP family intramembrane metalloprotease [Bacteroidia bacterium]